MDRFSFPSPLLLFLLGRGKGTGNAPLSLFLALQEGLRAWAEEEFICAANGVDVRSVHTAAKNHTLHAAAQTSQTGVTEHEGVFFLPLSPLPSHVNPGMEA